MSVQEKETDVQTYENNNLIVHVTKKPHCQVKFDITVAQPAVDAAYQKAIKTVSKEVSVPGFRKGKAPNHFIMEKYASAINEEFIDTVLQNGFNDALHLVNMHPIKDSLKKPLIKECSKEKGAHFIIDFESRVNPPDIHLDQIKVKRVVSEVITEEDRDDAIRQLLFQMAEFTPVGDRSVEENDFVHLDVILFGDLPKCVENQRIQVNSKSLPNWLYQKVIGLHVGEIVEGTTEPSAEKDEELSDEKPVPFKAILKKIWVAKTPELDDELVKKIGLESVQDLKEKMQERLEMTAIEDAFDRQVILIEKALIDMYPIDIPKSYLDDEYKIRLEEYLRPLLKQKMNDYISTHRQSIEDGIKKISLDRLSIYFILHAVAIKNKISPSQEDLNKEFNRQRSLMSINRGSLTANNKEELEKQLYNLAMEQKIKEFLLNNVTFIEN